MKKLNNSGFAITSILYSIMVLFLMLLLSILGILGSRKAILDKNKKDILEELNSEVLNNKFNFEHRNITIINNGNNDDIIYALMDGVTAVDENGNQISQGNISYNLDINNIENKDYTVTYTANNNGNNIIGTRKITFINNNIVEKFDFSGSEQEFTADYNGSYKVELWGASGGHYSAEYSGGKGGYTKGITKIDEDAKLYIYVGQENECVDGALSEKTTGGYNGGGTAGVTEQWDKRNYCGGGGATDIRLTSGNWDDFQSLKSRIMVAGGGGGASYFSSEYNASAGSSGGLSGYDSNGVNSGNSVISAGATQTSGYNFGIGASGTTNGAGGGYYGGTTSHWTGGSGGSSFISGYDGCNAIDELSTESNIIHTGQSIHYSGYKFSNSVMYAGNESIPNHDGTGTMVGNTGDGYAKISLIYYY